MVMYGFCHELGTLAQIQDFLVVLGIVSREARENLHIFRNICTTFQSNLVRSQRF